MIAIKNLLFQPLAFGLATQGQGLHLGPRESRLVSKKDVSEELRAAEKRGLVTLTQVVEAPKVQPEAQPKAAPASQTRSKARSKAKETPGPQSRKRGGKS